MARMNTKKFSKQSADCADDADFIFSKKFICENLRYLRTVLV